MKPFSCSDCEELKTIRIGDSFDRGEELTCKATNKIIDPYCDAKDFPPPLPKWCPRIGIM